MMSISLSGRLSPRATEPKTATRRTPRARKSGSDRRKVAKASLLSMCWNITRNPDQRETAKGRSIWSQRSTVGTPLSLDKLLAPIALCVEQGGEVAVVDPRPGRGRDGGFGVVGDAETGAFDHAEIVGAVADHQRVDIVEIEGFAQLGQGCEFYGG